MSDIGERLNKLEDLITQINKRLDCHIKMHLKSSTTVRNIADENKTKKEYRLDWNKVNESLANLQEDAPPCSECGMIMVRRGTCYYCDNCGSSNGSCG